MNNTQNMSRRKFSVEFKANVALGAMQERMTLSELSQKYEVHPHQITAWKKQLTDQGCQFTSAEYINSLKNHEIQISMDGRGRALDDIFIER